MLVSLADMAISSGKRQQTIDAFAKLFIVLLIIGSGLCIWILFQNHIAETRCEFITRLERIREDCEQYHSGSVWAIATEYNAELAVYKARGLMEYVPYIQQQGAK